MQFKPESLYIPQPESQPQSEKRKFKFIAKEQFWCKDYIKESE
jgi:hypothetical protein